ncbi:MAG: B-box zinc finger protein [Planctomycetes bacterium]|nr:B-box zinc finger protein [Planctomycetota bacterium]
MTRELMCFTHTDRPAVVRCRQCQKPVCSECVKSDSNGKFCSLECAQKFAEFQDRGLTRTRGGMGLLAKVFLLLAVLAAALYVGGRILHVPICEEILKKLNLP